MAGLSKQLNMASEDKVANLMHNHWRLHYFKKQTSNCRISNLITLWEMKTQSSSLSLDTLGRLRLVRN